MGLITMGLDWQVSDADLSDLRRRLRATRWPTPWPTPSWEAGTDAAELQRLVDYWINGFDWLAQQQLINDLPHHFADIDGVATHYLRFDGERDDALPLIVTNGWPSTFFEMVGLARRLSAPSSYGLGTDLCFTVIVPSLPGFTFSGQRPTLPADPATHDIWSRLMREHLGFETYFAHGGDLGAGITSRLAAAHPDEVLGAHLLAVGAPVELDEATLSDDERRFRASLASWASAEGAYMHQQQTRPLTLAYGLSDSPVGLLGWIVEKYRAWSDNDGALATSFTDDFLLTQACLYWFTNTIGTSFRPYYEFGRGVPRGLSWVPAPTAVALFPADLARPPRSWAERTHNVIRYTELPRGGHFAAIEVPDLLAEDLLQFARQVGSSGGRGSTKRP